MFFVHVQHFLGFYLDAIMIGSAWLLLVYGV